jgi:hypothetical protein
MQRLTLLLAMAVALALPSIALGAGTLTGKYTTKITTAGQFKGTWTLTFMKAGTYTVAFKGATLVNGKYTTSGSNVTLGHEKGPASCVPTGKYTWKRTGKTLKFTKISDSASACQGRILVLSRPFTKAG